MTKKRPNKNWTDREAGAVIETAIEACPEALARFLSEVRYAMKTIDENRSTEVFKSRGMASPTLGKTRDASSLSQINLAAIESIHKDIDEAIHQPQEKEAPQGENQKSETKKWSIEDEPWYDREKYEKLLQKALAESKWGPNYNFKLDFWDEEEDRAFKEFLKEERKRNIEETWDKLP